MQILLWQQSGTKLKIKQNQKYFIVFPYPANHLFTNDIGCKQIKMENKRRNVNNEDNFFKDSEESRYYRNFLSWWKMRFPSDEKEKTEEGIGSESVFDGDAKVFDHKSKKFVKSKEDKEHL